MKATQTLPAPAELCRPRVKKLPIKAIIYLTSEKFSIFVSVIATLIAWWGVCIDNERITAYGGLVFLVGFTPWAIRDIAFHQRPTLRRPGYLSLCGRKSSLY